MNKGDTKGSLMAEAVGQAAVTRQSSHVGGILPEDMSRDELVAALKYNDRMLKVATRASRFVKKLTEMSNDVQCAGLHVGRLEQLLDKLESLTGWR